MKFQFGDIIDNGWAGRDNPERRSIFIKFSHRSGRLNSGKHFSSMLPDGTRLEHPFEDNRMTVVGSIFQCGDLAECRSVLSARETEGEG